MCYAPLTPGLMLWAFRVRFPSAGTPYQGGYFLVRFEFGPEFPSGPPKCESAIAKGPAVLHANLQSPHITVSPLPLRQAPSQQRSSTQTSRGQARFASARSRRIGRRSMVLGISCWSVAPVSDSFAEASRAIGRFGMKVVGVHYRSYTFSPGRRTSCSEAKALGRTRQNRASALIHRSHLPPSPPRHA